MASRINEDLYTMPLFLTARAIGYIVGSICGTFVFQRLLYSNRKPLLFFLVVFLLSITSFSLSITTTFVTTSITFCAAGVCMAAIDTGNSVLCLHSKSGLHQTFLQFLYFSYAAGGLSAPLIARSYVRHTVKIKNLTEPMDPGNKTGHQSYYVTQLSTVFVIISGFLLVVSLLWFAAYCFIVNNPILEEPPHCISEYTTAFKNFAIFNSSLLFFFGHAFSFAYTQVLPIYWILAQNASQIDATDIMILFMGCFSISRLLLAIIARKISPHNMLSMGSVLLMSGGFFLYIYINYGTKYFLVSTALLGFAAGPIFPSLMAWLCIKMCMTHRSLLPIFLSGSLSELVLPVFLSRLLWPYTKIISHVIASFSIVFFIIVLCYFLVVYGSGRKFRKRCASSEEFVSIPTNVPCYQTVPPSAEPKIAKEVSRSINTVQLLDRIGEMRKKINLENQAIAKYLKDLEYGGIQLTVNVIGRKKEDKDAEISIASTTLTKKSSTTSAGGSSDNIEDKACNFITQESSTNVDLQPDFISERLSNEGSSKSLHQKTSAEFKEITCISSNKHSKQSNIANCPNKNFNNENKESSSEEFQTNNHISGLLNTESSRTSTTERNNGLNKENLNIESKDSSDVHN